MKTTLRSVLTAAIFLACMFSGFSQQVAKTIPNSQSPDGLIGFLEFKPTDYGTQRHPLIIFLHGIGERGNGTSQINYVSNNAIPKFCAAGASMRFTANGQTSSFVVLSPQLSVQYGYWPTYYVQEMINYAKANLQIDPNRIYVTGLSLGGGGVWRYATEVMNSNYSVDANIAAIAPVCGTQEEIDANVCSTIAANKLPVWAFHCMDDGTVGVGATQHAEILLSRCGMTPAPKFTYYQNGGHGGAWVNAFDTGHITTTVSGGGSFTARPNLYEWLLSNTRSASQPTNTAPTASAGNGQTITLPTSAVTLSGNGAGTNGASISSYAWTKASGPSASIVSPSSASTSVTGLSQGTYVFTLTVTDNHNLSTASNVTIIVNAAANTLPIANAGNAQSISLPTSSVTLAGSGSGTNGASITGYAWVKSSGPSAGTISNASSATTSVNGLAQGAYVFTLTVTDNHGLTSSASVNVNVAAATQSAPNSAPMANAGNNQTITLPTNSATLDATASRDADGSIVAYEWTQMAGPTMSFNRMASVTTVSNLVASSYNFVLKVTDNAGAISFSSVTITVNPAAAAPAAPTAGQPIGYIKQSTGSWQACADASSSGRTAIYASSIANGSILYTDAAQTKVFNGGWNWFSLTQTVGGIVTNAFAIYPDGSIHLLNYCSNGTPTTTPPATTPPVTTPPVTTPPVTNVLGYVKMSVGPYQACDDASTSGRIAVYGNGISNGSILYTDAAKTQIYNGGWNWFSFQPTAGSATTYAFAIYPNGSIGLLRNCATGGSSRVAAANTAAQDIATLRSIKDSSIASLGVKNLKLNLFPNPVHSSATIELNSTEDGMKTINIFSTTGVLKSKYNWPTVKGTNVFSLKDISGMADGLYIVDVRDNSGKSVGSIKFIKN